MLTGSTATAYLPRPPTFRLRNVGYRDARYDSLLPLGTARSMLSAVDWLTGGGSGARGLAGASGGQTGRRAGW